MSSRLRVILFSVLMVLSCVALAQPGNEPEPDLVMPDAAEDVVFPDSVPARIDTAIFSFGDTAQLENVVLRKKERRLELPKGVETTVSDTTNTSRIFHYNVNRFTNDVELLGIDTSLSSYRTDYPFFRADVGAFFLGNLGSPVMYYDFFKRTNDYDFIFQQPYAAYFFSPTNASFYNTTTPYTLLYYDWAGSKAQMEDQLRVLHAQNILSNLSFVLEYNNMGTKGQYPRQYIKNRSLNVGISYLGKYYKANIGYIFNDVEGQESGGIVDDKMITDTVVDPQMQVARLQNGKNTLKNHRFYLTHSLDIPMIYFGNDSVINNVLIGRIGHSMEYSTYSKLYTDQSDTSYYTNSYYSYANTRDSLGLRNFENKLFLQLRPMRAFIFESLTGGVGYKSMHSYMFEPGMYLTGASDQFLHTGYFYASASGWYKKYFQWNGFGELNFLGYKSGDYKLGGDLTFSVYPGIVKKGIHLTVSAMFSGTSPDMFIENYSTNHYKWTTDYNRETEGRLQAKLSIPSWRCEVSVSQSVFNNYIYFAGESTAKYGDNITPEQYDEALSITGLTVSQNLEAAGFHFNHRLLFQLSSDEKIVSLPKFALSASYYYECDIVKKVLRMQLGVDFQYATKFNGYGYNPSVGMFYTSQVQQGNYLWTDAFIAFRWKRATPFIKCEHVGQGLIDGNTNYFSAVHYPRNARVFKFGLSWKFFD